MLRNLIAFYNAFATAFYNAFALQINEIEHQLRTTKAMLETMKGSW